MKEENSFPSIKSSSALDELDSPQLGEDAVESSWHNVIKRRSFLKGISLAGATVTAGGLIGTQLSAQTKENSRRLS